MEGAYKFLTQHLELICVAGATLAFLLWERRVKNLEICKLRLEIEALEETKRIYRPTNKEIEDILRLIDPKNGSGRAFEARATPLDDIDQHFGEIFREFALNVGCYFGSETAKRIVNNENMSAVQRGRSPPHNFDATNHPDPEIVVRAWGGFRSAAQERLSFDTFSAVERFVNTFAQYRQPSNKSLETDA